MSNSGRNPELRRLGRVQTPLSHPFPSLSWHGLVALVETERDQRFSWFPIELGDLIKAVEKSTSKQSNCLLLSLIETLAFKWSIEELSEMAFEVLLFFSIHTGSSRGLGSSNAVMWKDRLCNYLATQDLQCWEKRPKWEVEACCYYNPVALKWSDVPLMNLAIKSPNTYLKYDF